MSNLRSSSKRIISECVAGVKVSTFDISQYKHVSIQVKATAACLPTASVVCEDLSLSCNSYTEASHGYVTGLKGVLAAVTGCAAVVASACIAVASCVATFTLACHGLTTGERGQFTTSCALPTGVSACTDYYAINVSASTFRVASSRANALAGTSAAISAAGTGNQTFTPNGAIPAGSTANSWIIKVDDDTFKLATSKANALAGTVDEITALNSPANITFTPAAGDATSGTVTVRYSNCTTECAVYLTDTGIGLLATPAVINACTCGLSVIDAEVGVVPYKSMQVTVCVTDSQWDTKVDIHAKE